MTHCRIVALMAAAAAALTLAGCASTPEQYASRECKIAPADFIDHPKKNPTRAEQAAAEFKVQRLAYAHGGYTLGNSMLVDAVRDCY
jgi:hypothetical protein